MLLVGIVALGLAIGWLIVMHTYLYQFQLPLYATLLKCQKHGLVYRVAQKLAHCFVRLNFIKYGTDRFTNLFHC